MTLEEEVAKPMDDAVKGSPRVLAALVGEGTLAGPVDVDLLSDLMIGQRRAIQHIAREIDKARDAGTF